MREESEEFKTTEEDNVYSGEPKKNEGHTLAGYRERIFQPGTMRFAIAFDLRLPHNLMEPM